MKRILMDCDPGIDDAIAMILALQSGALQVEAFTAVTGNLTADRTCANALKVLDLIQDFEIQFARTTVGAVASRVQDPAHDERARRVRVAADRTDLRQDPPHVVRVRIEVERADACTH